MAPASKELGPDNQQSGEPLSLAGGSAVDYDFRAKASQQAFARWFHGVTILSAELAQFIQARLQDDMAAWSALAACRTSEEALECQRRFAERATTQYSEEITKLSHMMVKLAADGLGSFQRRVDTDPA
jgi:phasin family protein